MDGRWLHGCIDLWIIRKYGQKLMDSQVSTCLCIPILMQHFHILLTADHWKCVDPTLGGCRGCQKNVDFTLN